jgi:hypothetical protein
VIFQCAHCRSLVDVTEAIVDVRGVGLPCSACGQHTRLQRRETTQVMAVLETREPMGGRDVPRSITHLPGLGHKHDGVEQTVEFLRAPSTPVPVGSINTTVEFLHAGAAITAPPNESVLDRARARIEALPPPATDTQRSLADGFGELLSSWNDSSKHKALLMRASVDGELQILGQRYRAVLDVDPSNAAAKAAQEELLSLAMVTMSRAKNSGTLDEKPSGIPMPLLAAGIVAALVVFGLVLVKSIPSGGPFGETLGAGK